MDIIGEHPHEEVHNQHENASAHTASKTRFGKSQRNIHLLYWPLQSLDQNPIEHLWELMLKQIKHKTSVTQKHTRAKVCAS